MLIKTEVAEPIKETQVHEGERMPLDLYQTHLTPLEHAIIGSSVEAADGSGLISGEEILKQADNFLFRPLRIINGEEELMQILKERRGKYIEGYISMLHSREMLEEGCKQRIWLPTEVQEDGTIRPRFRVQLIGSNGEVVEDEARIKKILKITRRREYFTLSPGEVPGERIIEFKKPMPKAA